MIKEKRLKQSPEVSFYLVFDQAIYTTLPCSCAIAISFIVVMRYTLDVVKVLN